VAATVARAGSIVKSGQRVSLATEEASGRREETAGVNELLLSSGNHPLSHRLYLEGSTRANGNVAFIRLSNDVKRRSSVLVLKTGSIKKIYYRILDFRSFR